MERADKDIAVALREHPTLDTFKSVMVQVLHALETAWCTHRFLHLDLHTQNVMTKTVKPSSASANKAWVFTRAIANAPRITIPAHAHTNSLVKLIDFGMSQMRAPQSVFQWNVSRHKHDLFLNNHMQQQEKRASRSVDMRNLLSGLLLLNIDPNSRVGVDSGLIETIFKTIEIEEDKIAFKDFFNVALGGANSFVKLLTNDPLNTQTQGAGAYDTILSQKKFFRDAHEPAAQGKILGRLALIRKVLVTSDVDTVACARIQTPTPTDLLGLQLFTDWTGRSSTGPSFEMAMPMPSDCMEEIPHPG